MARSCHARPTPRHAVRLHGPTRASGTIAELVVTDGARARRRRPSCSRRSSRDIDRVASRFRADSELSRLNAAAGPRGAGHARSPRGGRAWRSPWPRRPTGWSTRRSGAAMNRLGYDRDFSLVRGGVRRAAARRPGRPGVALRRPRPRTSAPSPCPPDTALDLGATAKALAADRAAATIHAPAGLRRAGLARGRRRRGRPGAGGWVRRRDRRHLHVARTPPRRWRIARVGSPRRASASAVAARERTRSITSSTQPPACRRPPCWRTVSVTAATCVEANAASTAAVVLGARSRRRGSKGSASGAPRGTRRIASPGPPAGPTPDGSPAPSTTPVARDRPSCATVGHGSTALWYLTRATGLVSLILLSATVVLGHGRVGRLDHASGGRVSCPSPSTGTSRFSASR